MGTRILVVSLGRVVADHVRVDATEAYAVLQQVWQRIEATRDEDRAAMALPPLDAMGITPFGDFEIREKAWTSERRVRRPHQLVQELGGLLLRLLSAADGGLERVPPACLDAARRASSADARCDTRGAIASPDALFAALEEFRPADPSAALAALFARWSRTTDRRHAAPWDARAPAQRALGDRVRGAADRAVAAPAPRPSNSRRSLAGLVALTCLLLVGVLAWHSTTRQRGDESADRAVADSAHAPTRTTADDKIAAVESLAAEVGIATPLPRMSASKTPVRARRLLDAGTTGRPPYSPSFDPQKNAIVFHAGLERTTLLQASLGSDGAVDEITTVRQDGSRSYHVQISPDGEHLAYDSDVDGTRGVYIANRDGSSPRRVSGTDHASVPTWSPDGQYVAFARAEPGRPRVWNVWMVHVPTGRLRRHTSHRVGQVWGASWFPDGRRIAYSVEDRLVVRDLESDVSRAYPTPVAGRLVRTPAVSPDGQRIVLQVHRDGAWVLDLRSGTYSRLLADASAQEFAWSPDGRRVAYHSVRGGEWGIWMLEMATAP